jgi:Fur family ferric uptake transcriptional regulator
MKVTQARVRILEILERQVHNDVTQKHLGAEDIYRLLLDEGADVGIATVYRVLTQFVSAGLVARHNFEGGSSVYELARESHHDHMVCLETGQIVEFCNEEIESLQNTIAKQHGFELVDHNLVLYVRPSTGSGDS